MPILFVLLALLGAFLSLPARADLVDFHFGGLNQTGPAVLGNTGDIWNTTQVDNGGPVLLQDVQGAATPISISWTSGDSWAATKAISSSTTGSTMDAATSWLMRSCLSSYQYGSGPTNLTVSITGLVPGQAYALVLLGAGGQVDQGTQFTVTGTGIFTGSTSGLNRKLSGGAGDAYTTLAVVSSSAGTLKITTIPNGTRYAVLNGFQLGQPLAWGVCGHPTWSDYANWIPANVTTQIGYLQQLGCKYYRCSFEGGEYPAILDTVVPQSQAAGITVLPILPLTLTPSATAASNYTTNYQTANKWATYAISKGYTLPYWELGNELENDDLVNVVYDGASPNDFPDAVPGGFVAIASGLSGAYQGVKDAYTAGRKSGLTTVTPQVLYGATYRHWGLLAKILNYNGSLPCDILSWHWYGPNYGVFNQPISDPNSVSNGLTPAQCLNAFKSHTNPTQPMDIWITENNRSQEVTGQGLLNGSTASNTAPASHQDWAAEATAIQNNVDSFKTVPTVKAIFVFELLDEPKADSGSTALLASEGYFGLVTGLNGVLKTAFYTYQTEIKQGP